MPNPARKSAAALVLPGLCLAATASVLASPVVPDVAAGPSPITAGATVASPYQWSTDAVGALLEEAHAARQEGIDPVPYDLESLAAILASSGESAATDLAATRVALALARDYANGRVIERARLDWHIAPAGPDLNQLSGDLREALHKNRLRPWLRSLLPSDPRYASLRSALAATIPSDRETRDRLRANLERWRWMPRSPGKDHIYVNVPSYRLAVIDEGRMVST